MLTYKHQVNLQHAQVPLLGEEIDLLEQVHSLQLQLFQLQHLLHQQQRRQDHLPCNLWLHLFCQLLVQWQYLILKPTQMIQSILQSEIIHV